MPTVVGTFDTRSEAESAIRRLREAGIAQGAIGVAMKDVRAARSLEAATGVNDLTGEAAAAGAISGATVGTLVGLALVGSTLVLPGVGTLLVGGPLAAALAGASIGAASGSLVGALIAAGLPEHEAANYASQLEQGQILVSLNVTDDQAPAVRKILDDESARHAHPAGT